MDNNIEETFLLQGWPSDVIEKLKQLFDIKDLKKLCYVDYHNFNDYISRYPFLDLEMAAKIFIEDLQGIDLDIFGDHIDIFINLLKRNKTYLINGIIRLTNLGIPLEQILPIIDNLDREDIFKLISFYSYFNQTNKKINIQEILPILRNVEDSDIYNFLQVAINTHLSFQKTLEIYKKLGSIKFNFIANYMIFLKIDILELEALLSKIPNEENIIRGQKLIYYIENEKDFEYILSNIHKIQSVEDFENYISQIRNLNSEKLIFYFNLFIKYSFNRDIYNSLMRLDQLSNYSLNSFEEYDYYLSNFKDEEIYTAWTFYKSNKYLSMKNCFELATDTTIDHNLLAKRFDKIHGCTKLTVEEAKYLNECDEDFLKSTIRQFFNRFFNVPFSYFLLANNSLKLENNNKRENFLIFKTIHNIMVSTNCDFKQALKLYKQGFNDYSKIQSIEMNLVANSISEFKLIYYMIDKMDENTINYFSYYLKEGIDFFDALELAKLKQKEVSDKEEGIEEKELEKNWYYLKIKIPKIFYGIKQTEENLRDTSILYKNIIENYRSDMKSNDFIEIRDIYLNHNIPLYDFIESYYQYSESNLNYSFFIFLNEKYGLRSEDLIEKMKVIDQNLIEVEESTGKSSDILPVLKQRGFWG